MASRITAVQTDRGPIGNVVSLNTFGDPHLAAVLLKKYLRDLPEPIFPERVYGAIRRCLIPSEALTDMSSVQYIRETLLPELTPCSAILLSHVLRMYSFGPVSINEMTYMRVFSDLLHEVSLRAATNKMDSHNLAVVICPNLVKGSNTMKDVLICAIPNGPTLHASASASIPSNPADEGKATLGQVIKLCIERYYEIFDEAVDRSEVRQSSLRLVSTDASPQRRSPSPSYHSHPVRNRDSIIDDDEDIDDAMLVMSIGPSGSGSRSNNGAAPPSAWNGPAKNASKHRESNSKDFEAARSVFTAASSTMSNVFGTVGRSKSMISIEKGSSGTSRKGSISIGRGTTRKSSGSGVEAVGITASGFFSPPSLVPPVPSPPLRR